MYEVRQSKEKVSRRIDISEGTRLRRKIAPNHLYAFPKTIKDILQKVQLPNVTQKNGNSVDTEDREGIRKFLISALVTNQRLAIEQMFNDVKAVDPEKENDIKSILDVLNNADILVSPYFEAEARTNTKGFYYEKACQGRKRDAEVTILQQAENWIKDKSFLSSYLGTLYISLSSGPCNSCKNLMSLFSSRNQNISIIIKYHKGGDSEYGYNVPIFQQGQYDYYKIVRKYTNTEPAKYRVYMRVIDNRASMCINDKIDATEMAHRLKQGSMKHDEILEQELAELLEYKIGMIYARQISNTELTELTSLGDAEGVKSTSPTTITNSNAQYILVNGKANIVFNNVPKYIIEAIHYKLYD